MATVRVPITRLPAATALDEDSLLPMVQDPDGDAQTVKATLAQVSSLISIGISLAARYAMFASGKPGAAETLVQYIIKDSITFPSGLSGSRGESTIASTGAPVFSIQKNGVEFGTATFTASNLAVFAGVSTDFEDGDILSIVAPVLQDATLSGVSITLEASRNL